MLFGHYLGGSLNSLPNYKYLGDNCLVKRPSLILSYRELISVRLRSGVSSRLFLALLLCLQPFPARCEADVVAPEYKLKAALLYKLTWFIEWPPETIEPSSGSFGICTLGENGFGDLLESLQGRELKGLTVKVHHYLLSEDVRDNCKLLFISQSKKPFLKDILNQLEGTSTLTISDINEFARVGGMIEFRQDKESIGFNINLEKARRGGLEIAAPLLEMTNVVIQRER